MTGRGIILLFIAIVGELIGTISLKLSDGFSKPTAVIFVALGYFIAFFALSLSLKQGTPLGTAYAIWAGLGTVGTAIAGAYLFQDRVNSGTVTGILFIIAGIIILNLYSQAH